MKRCLAILLVAMMCFSVFTFSDGFALANSTFTSNSRKQTVNESVDVLVNDKMKATFVCDAPCAGTEVALFDESGRVVAKMNDSGVFGDKAAGDGVYSATVALKSADRKITTYAAKTGNDVLNSYTVNFYNEFSDKDYEINASVCASLREIEFNAENATDAQVLNSVYSYLSNCADVEKVTCGDGYVCFTTTNGIQSVFTRFSDDTKGSGDIENELTVMTPDGVQTYSDADTMKTDTEYSAWTNPNVLVVRPYRNDPEEPGFASDRYLDVANSIAEVTGGTITTLDNMDTIPYNLLDNFYKNGFVLVDSHGIDIEEQSYMIVGQGKGYTAADLAAGRVLLGVNDYMCVTGTLFKAHYEEEGKTLDNTVCYFGICLGMKYPSLNQPLLDLGAKAVVGYNESVSFGYEWRMITTMFTRLISISQTDSQRSYSVSEAINYAKDTVGEVDTNNGIAVMVMAGNENFVMVAPHVNVLSMSFENDAYKTYVNNIGYIVPKIMPETAYGYTQVWESSDSSILEVVGPRLFKGKRSGIVTLTCTITDGTNGEIILNDSCQVTVDFMNISDFSVSLNSNARLYVGQSRQVVVSILPYNASNQDVEFSSNNPGTISVDDNGKLIALRPGKAKITCYAQDGAIVSAVNINVSDKEVYNRTTGIEANSSYIIVERTRSEALVARLDDGYLTTRVMQPENNYLGGTISNNQVWTFKEADGGYYICSQSADTYITQGKNGTVELSAVPTHIFAMEGRKLYITNPTYADNAYMRVREGRGADFNRSSLSSSIELYKKVDFSDDTKFSTVTFEDHDGSVIATQTVENGSKAVAAIPVRDGYTFLGWDICLDNITSDITANALYREGTTDKCVVTFKDVDGTTISTEEIVSGKNVTPPTPPQHDGYKFSKWSEALRKVTQNMTVFAMYNSNWSNGDVNMDGQVNTGDAIVILRYSAGTVQFDADEMTIADMNCDKQVNTGDAIAVLRASVA